MQRVVGSLQSALTIEFADRVVHQWLETTADLDRINPVSVTAAPPATYVGEFRESVPAGVEKGQWFFDTRSRTLVYLVRNDAWFESPLGAPQRARFQVELVFDDRNANGRYDRGIDKIEGVRLTPAEDFTWRKAPRN